MNAVVAHVARTVYDVPSVVSRNYDPRWRPLHEAMGLRMVSSTAWGAQRVEELLENRRVRPVFSAGNGEVELYELDVPEPWDGRPLSELLRGRRLHGGERHPRRARGDARAATPGCTPATCCTSARASTARRRCAADSTGRPEPCTS